MVLRTWVKGEGIPMRQCIPPTMTAVRMHRQTECGAAATMATAGCAIVCACE